MTSGSYFGEDIFFSDSKACLIEVNLKKGGSSRSASYKRVFTRPEFFDKVLIANIYDMEHAVVSFEIPSSLWERFSIEERNIPEGKMTKTTEQKGVKRILTYEFKDIDSPVIFSDAPSINTTVPQLAVRGHFSDTAELYSYLSAYVDPQDPGNGDVAAKTHEVTEGLTTDKEKIDAITEFVHANIRYVAVEHGELAHRPDYPSEVLRKRYGDCKGSAALLKSMLKAAGIDGRLVWTGTRETGSTWSSFPSLSSGNHMIAAAVYPDSIVYIDGTARYHEAGAIPASLQGREALIEGGAEGHILSVFPKENARANTTETTVRMKIAADGIIKAEGKIRLRGNPARRLMGAYDRLPPAKLNEAYSLTLVSALGECIPGDASMRHIGDGSIEIAGSATVSGSLKYVGDELYADLNPAADYLRGLRFDTTDRNVGGRISSTRAVFDSSFSLDVPEGMTPSSLPEPYVVESPWIHGTLSTTLTEDGKSIERRLQLSIDDPEVAQTDLERFNDIVNRLHRACSEKIIFSALTSKNSSQ